MSDLIVFYKERYGVKFEYVPWKNFVSFLLLGFTLVNTKKIDFEDD